MLTTTPVAPWRSALEETIKANLPDDPQNLFYVSLATIKPFGRPANRTVFFRGFLTHSTTPFHAAETDPESEAANNKDSDFFPHHTPMDRSASTEQTIVDILGELTVTEPESEKDMESVVQHADPSNVAVENALNNVIVFVTDVRSGNVEDLIHGSRFGEVCWFFPHTKEQFRLSGTLHLVVSPDHPLVTTHKIGYPVFTGPTSPGHPTTTTIFPIDWEQKRLEIWRQLSSVRRASFTWPKPGAPCTEGAAMGPTLTTLSAKFKATKDDTATSNNNHHALGTTTVYPHHRHASPHAHALSNFCLLLLEVDGADHLRLADIPHVRVKYRKSTGADILEHAVQNLPQTEWTTSHQMAAHEDPIAEKHMAFVNAGNVWSVNPVNP
ncbi:pyridoxamine 5'-phosphate oxidase-domain-containing protein [Cladochytrium replicatum]|nr:pyridoxamine 5'-phosphate oxidase-domain-containing protein [Cladochytrium replicatum]